MFVNKLTFIRNNGVLPNGLKGNLVEVPLFEFAQPQEDKKNKYQEAVNVILYNIGINNWAYQNLKNDNDAIFQSQKHLVDLIRYYEGDNYHYYEPITLPYKDTGGTWTCGFGIQTKQPLSEEQAYEKLVRHLETFANDIKQYLNNNVQDGLWETLPNSIKQGLLDLCYNKGLGTISGNNELTTALKDKDWSKVIKNLEYTKLKSSGASNEISPGLCRRSLSRAILAAKDLNGKELKEAKKEIKTLYEKYVKIFNSKKISTVELDKIYEAYSTGNITGKPVTRDSDKVYIGKKYEGKGARFIADRLYEEQGLTESVMSKTDFYKLIYKYNRFSGENPTVKINTYWNVPIIKTQKDPIQDTAPQADATDNIYKISNATTFYSIANVLLPNEDKQIKVKFIQILLDKNPNFRNGDGIDNDDWPKCKNIDANSNLVIPNTVDINGKTINITPPANWEVVSNAPKGKYTPRPQSSSVPTEESDDESTSLLDRMNQEFGDSCITDKEIGVKTMGLKCREFKYTVQPKDTLWAVSHRYNVSVETLKRYNKLTSSSLQIGQTLLIPKIIYTIKKGDVLNKIVQKFGLSIDVLKDLNSIDDVNKISVNQIIEIPAYPHTVKSGETLSSIAKKAGVTVDALKTVNGLKSNVIKENDKLLILYNNPDDSSDNKVRSENNNGQRYVAPAEGNYKEKYPFYSKHYKNGKIVATKYEWGPTNQNGPLKGRRIIINPGHGYTTAGHDPGAINKKCNYTESEIAYQNAIALSDKLRAAGATVIFIQGGVNLAYDAIKEESKADMMISLHVNSSKAKEVSNDRVDIYYNKNFPAGKTLANSIESAIDKKHPSNQDYANTRTANHAVTRALGNAGNKTSPAILVELGFINNSSFRSSVNNNPLRNETIDAIYNSVLKYKFSNK